jgi:hypothetical protein
MTQWIGEQIVSQTTELASEVIAQFIEIGAVTTREGMRS